MPGAYGNFARRYRGSSLFTQGSTNTTPSAPNPSITTAEGSLTPAGQVGSSSTFTFAATSGTPAYTWSATGQPTGMTMNSSTGVLAGPPTLSGTFAIAVTVTDSLAHTDTKHYTFAVSAAPSAGDPVPYTGPRVGLGVSVNMHHVTLDPFGHDPLQVMANAGVAFFNLGGSQQWPDKAIWDDHQFPATCDSPGIYAGGTYRNDLGQALTTATVTGDVSGDQVFKHNPGNGGFPNCYTAKPWASYYFPGGFTDQQNNGTAARHKWSDDTWWSTFCNRMKNLAAWITTTHSGITSTRYDGIQFDFENNWMFGDFVYAIADIMSYEGLTEAQLHQKAHDRGSQVMTAIIQGWRDDLVGHGVYFTHYSTLFAGDTREKQGIDNNGLPVAYADHRLFRAFIAGMASPDTSPSGTNGKLFGGIWYTNAAGYRYPQIRYPDGTMAAADQSGWDYSYGLDHNNWRSNIVNYSGGNAYWVFAHPELCGDATYMWFDCAKPPRSDGFDSNASPSVALTQVQRAALKVEGLALIFTYDQWPSDFNWANYTPALAAYPPA